MMTGGRGPQKPPGFPLTIRLFCFLMIHHPWLDPGQCPATFGTRSRISILSLTDNFIPDQADPEKYRPHKPYPVLNLHAHKCGHNKG
jgi:hypothetical protein